MRSHPNILPFPLLYFPKFHISQKKPLPQVNTSRSEKRIDPTPSQHPDFIFPIPSYPIRSPPAFPGDPRLQKASPYPTCKRHKFSHQEKHIYREKKMRAGDIGLCTQRGPQSRESTRCPGYGTTDFEGTVEKEGFGRNLEKA